MRQRLEVVHKKNGGVSARIGERFFDVIEKLKDARRDARSRNHASKERISTEKITNLIMRHKHWQEIFTDIVELPEEEVNRYGL